METKTRTGVWLEQEGYYACGINGCILQERHCGTCIFPILERTSRARTTRTQEQPPTAPPSPTPPQPPTPPSNAGRASITTTASPDNKEPGVPPKKRRLPSDVQDAKKQRLAGSAEAARRTSRERSTPDRLGSDDGWGSGKATGWTSLRFDGVKLILRGRDGMDDGAALSGGCSSLDAAAAKTETEAKPKTETETAAASFTTTAAATMTVQGGAPSPQPVPTFTDAAATVLCNEKPCVPHSEEALEALVVHHPENEQQEQQQQRKPTAVKASSAAPLLLSRPAGVGGTKTVTIRKAVVAKPPVAPPAKVSATPAAAAPATSDMDAASALLGLIGTPAAPQPPTVAAGAPAATAPAVQATALQKSRPTTPPMTSAAPPPQPTALPLPTPLLTPANAQLSTTLFLPSAMAPTAMPGGPFVAPATVAHGPLKWKRVQVHANGALVAAPHLPSPFIATAPPPPAQPLRALPPTQLPRAQPAVAAAAPQPCVPRALPPAQLPRAQPAVAAAAPQPCVPQKGKALVTATVVVNKPAPIPASAVVCARSVVIATGAERKAAAVTAKVAPALTVAKVASAPVAEAAAPRTVVVATGGRGHEEQGEGHVARWSSSSTTVGVA